MLIRELSGKEIGDWSDAVIDCPCGSKHELSTRFFIYDGAEKDLNAACGFLAPSGCGIILVYESGYDVSVLLRTLRRGGYRVYEHALRRGDGYAKLESLPVSDDICAALGVGGGFIADCAKYLGALLSVPCGVVVRSHASPSLLVPSAALGTSRPQLFKTPSPKVIVCDPSLLPSGGSFNAAAFGGIVSRVTALFDWKFASLVRGEKMCEEIYEAALGEVDGLMERLGGLKRSDKRVKAILLESGLRLSALAAFFGGSRIFSGGDTACALAFDSLLRHEGRKGRCQGENEFLFSLLLARTYPKMFEALSPGGFLPPPDNNLRAEKLTEYLGIDEGVAAFAVTPYLSQKAMALYDYRLSEYEDEIKQGLQMLGSRLPIAHRIFRRLHNDDGFALKGYLTKSEAELCLALAPEMRGKYTALTHMKNMGLTDAYLLD